MVETLGEIISTEQKAIPITVVKPPGLLAIFWTFFKIGAFTFGGGYAMISLIKRELVDNKGWIEAKDFADCFASTQLIPGAVAINMGLVTGSAISGTAGGLVAAFGVTLPSFIIISLIAAVFHNLHQLEAVKSFFKGVQPVIVGLILATAMDLARQNINKRWKWLTAAGGLVLMLAVNIHPVVIIAAASGFSLILNKEY
ncbi:MAG: chromate transporter [Firmicutes bacterium]|nr:chromate transporter [Bacillota bacterium]